MACYGAGQGRGVTRRCRSGGIFRAPAGYGKTVLLADWARHSGYPVAWLSLDAGDNDPDRFWRHAVAALDRARPGTGERLVPVIGRAGQRHGGVRPGRPADQA